MSFLKKLIFCSLLPGWLGTLYFLLLVLKLPFWLMPMILITLFTLQRRRIICFLREDSNVIDSQIVKFMAVGLSVLFLMGISIFKFYGEADASSMWNYYARFLYHEQSWRGLFIDTGLANHNHPLLLSSFIACFWHVTGSYPSWVIPQLAGWLPLILMPVLLLIHFYRRAPWIAFGLFLLLAGNVFYINMGINQYADIWVSLFFFISVLSVVYWRKDRDVVWLWLWGSALGAAAFTKNEGIMLSLFSAIFLYKDWSKKPLAGFVGFLPFLIAIGVHKLMFQVASPVVATWNKEAITLLFEKERLFLILKYLEDNLSGIYSVMTWGLIAVLINAFRLREWPDSLWWLMIASLAGYTAVYLTLTENGVEWNLSTSMVRILLHLMPASYLVAAEILLQRTRNKSLINPSSENN